MVAIPRHRAGHPRREIGRRSEVDDPLGLRHAVHPAVCQEVEAAARQRRSATHVAGQEIAAAKAASDTGSGPAM